MVGREHFHMINLLKLLLLVSHRQACKLARHPVPEKEQAQIYYQPYFSSDLQEGSGMQ